MEEMSLKDLALPLIKSIDSFNFLLKSHHKKTAVISYYLGLEMNLSQKDMIDLIISASMHDIGALSVTERDMLVQEDVENPKPHCDMGYKMLSSFDTFKTIAQIIKHHHIKYSDLDQIKDEVFLQSHIIHLADRVDIYTEPRKFILDQKDQIKEKILSKESEVFHPDVCRAFESISKIDVFWIEIENMSMEQLFSKVNFDLYQKLSREQIMQFSLVVSRIIDFRSRFTASHSYTVGNIAYKIGELLNYDEEICTKLLIAGYFHDIGKIGINTDFIEKPGPLTDDEFNHVKLHSYYTGQILSGLSNSSWFKDVVYWAKNHHEKVDGTGYPMSLKGEAVNEGTLIIEFSDIISALMENRPYRKGMTIEKAFEIMEKEMVSHLDASMFKFIKENKNEINRVVQFSQLESFATYQNNL